MEDFGEDWGAMDDDEVADAWGDPDETERKVAAQKSAAATANSTPSYNDQSEPDFEGWLNAQAQAKKQTKTPLPKGLMKKTNTTIPSKPTPLRTASTPAGSKPAATKPVAASKPVAAPAEEDDDWGEAWG